MANVKCFFKKQFSFLVILIAAFGTGFSFQAKAETNPQMINLNMQFKAKNQILKSDLAMPFYQTAELEKHFDNKNVLIEVNPRRGKNSNEITIEMKFFKTSGSKAFAKKDIIAKLGEESKITVKGMTVKVTPIL
ncbi:MAG: hypothetical protein Q7U04_06530 [Bacteriovorax sp.]|nr:hypothetical protein [Bacteriovorax sp.]